MPLQAGRDGAQQHRQHQGMHRGVAHQANHDDGGANRFSEEKMPNYSLGLNYQDPSLYIKGLNSKHSTV